MVAANNQQPLRRDLKMATRKKKTEAEPFINPSHPTPFKLAGMEAPPPAVHAPGYIPEPGRTRHGDMAGHNKPQKPSK
jgi:hypothetical protein